MTKGNCIIVNIMILSALLPQNRQNNITKKSDQNINFGIYAYFFLSLI